jgi:hypothetical protein
VSTPLPYSLAKEAQAAGAQQALRDLGLAPPDEDLEKTAFWAQLGRGAMWLGGKAAKGLGRIAFGKPGQEAGKGILSRVSGALGGVSRFAGKPFQSMGQGIYSQAAKMPWFQQGGRLAALQRLGKGLPAHMGGFGAFSGTASALTAEPGEDRFKAFGKGFLGGAAMGATMGLGGNVFKAGLGKALGAKRMQGLQQAAQGIRAPAGGQSLLTSGALKAPSQLTNIRAVTGGQKAMDFARKWGAKSALGGGAFLAGDVALAPFDMSITRSLYQMGKGQEPSQPLYAHPQIYTAPMAYAARRYGGGGYMGLMPGHAMATPGFATAAHGRGPYHQ